MNAGFSRAGSLASGGARASGSPAMRAGKEKTVIVVVMGVSGCGKTTVAALIAARLGWRYREGDDLHPKENVEKMRGGTPLTDADRLPWLQAIAREIDRWRTEGESGVVTCSALKRSYRDVIIGDRPEVALVYLKGSRDLIARRMAARHEHFMPAALLTSQFATLQEPTPAERPIVVDVGGAPDEIAGRIVQDLEFRCREGEAASRLRPGPEIP